MKKIYLYVAIFFIIINGYATELKVKEYELKNGLRVIFVERRESPTFGVVTLFPSGRVDEPEGKAGIAHLVEHMLFKGTKTIGTKDYEKESILLNKLDSLAILLAHEKDSSKIKKLEEEFNKLEEEASKYEIKGDLANIYQKHGARSFNAATSMDATFYYLKLPSNKLELWARITSDVINNTVFRGFYKEKDVVMQEIRMGKDEPSSVFWDKLTETAFKIHPYGKPIAGEVEDVKKLTIDDIKEFYKNHYVPSNTFIGIVGNLNFDEVKSVVDKYFSHIPKRKFHKKEPEKEPKQTQERREIIELEAEPRIAVAYHIPTFPEFDVYVLEIISDILSRGRTSRLYKRMVETKIATSATTWRGTPGIKHPNLFIFWGEPIHPYTTEELEKIFFEEIEKLKTEPVSEFEIRKVKNQIKVDFLKSLQSNLILAKQLVYFEAFFGDWSKVYEYIDMIEKVTPEDIIRVANKYFTKENRTVVISIKKGEEKKLIDIAIEYYKQKKGEEPTDEMMNMINEIINQIEILEKSKGVSIPREQKIQAIKQTIDALIGGKK